MPTSSSRPTDITAGSDGSLWFTEGYENSNTIGNITTSGTITEYQVPTSNSAPTGITYGTDGSIWFTENLGNKIGRVNLTSGTPSPTPTNVEFKAPFGMNASSAHHPREPSKMYAAVCQGLSGIPTLQTNQQTGEVGYSAFGWGGFCSFYNTHKKPAQVTTVQSLVGNVFTSPVDGTYRITANINLQGSERGEAGSNAYDIAQSFVPGSAGDLLGLLGAQKLTNPANILPSVATAQNMLVLKVISTDNVSSPGFPNVVVDTVLHDSQEQTFAGTYTITTTVHLKAGQRVSILSGLSTDIKAWGNASVVVKTLASKVENIVVQQR